jgi:hypothetical protein
MREKGQSLMLIIYAGPSLAAFTGRHAEHDVFDGSRAKPHKSSLVRVRFARPMTGSILENACSLRFCDVLIQSGAIDFPDIGATLSSFVACRPGARPLPSQSRAGPLGWRYQA